MNTVQITEILRSNSVTKNYFLGCFSADRLAEIRIDLRHNFFFITNILSSHENGMGHWLLLYVYNKDVLFFDSFGLQPSNYNNVYINNFLHAFKPMNISVAQSYPLQSEKSLLCGAYCIYVSYHLCNNYSIENILAKFTVNSRMSNDKRVDNFLEDITGTRKHCNRFMCPTLTFNDVCKSKCNCL